MDELRLKIAEDQARNVERHPNGRRWSSETKQMVSTIGPGETNNPVHTS